MSDYLDINRLAVHYVDKPASFLEIAKSEQDIALLDSEVKKFLMKLINDIWEVEETGKIYSGYFSKNAPAVATRSINSIKVDEDGFLEASVSLARHLYAVSPGNASPALFAVFRLVRRDNGNVHVVLLKIENKDRKVVRLSRAERTQITVEDIPNLLLEKIQKGAIIPHPSKKSYDVKLVDKQRTDLAIYFSEGFLGCVTKKSDEHQVKQLIPELGRYAQRNKLPFSKEKALNLLIALEDGRKDITTPFVSRVAKEINIMGSDFDPDDFADYIDEESSIGMIDIPRMTFMRKKATDRRVRINFTDPKLSQIEIIGPYRVLQDLIDIEEDTMRFSISTTKDSFEFNYDK